MSGLTDTQVYVLSPSDKHTSRLSNASIVRYIIKEGKTNERGRRTQSEIEETTTNCYLSLECFCSAWDYVTTCIKEAALHHIDLSRHQFICPSITVHLSVRLYIYLSVHLS